MDKDNDEYDSFNLYIGESADHELLQAQEETDLISKAQKGDQEAKSELITKNQRLVLKLANRYIGKAGNLEMMDLIQWGNLGLIEAINRFDLSRNVRFSTYAVFWIRAVLCRNAIKHGTDMSVSEHAGELISNIKWSFSELTQKLKRAPTLEEVADFLGEPVKKVNLVWQTYGGTLSLDQDLAFRGDKGTTLGEIIPDTDSIDLETGIEIKQLREAISEALKKMNPIEREVIIMRVGLDGKDQMTLEEIGDHYGKSRETIRHIQRIGMKKLALHLNFMKPK